MSPKIPPCPQNLQTFPTRGNSSPKKAIRNYVSQNRSLRAVHPLHCPCSFVFRRVNANSVDNEIKKIELFDKKIEFAKKFGATEQDLAPVIKNLFYKPLMKLDRYDDVIDSVEVKTDDATDS